MQQKFLAHKKAQHQVKYDYSPDVSNVWCRCISKTAVLMFHSLKVAVQHLRTLCATPILTGLPFGHVPTKLTLPQGRRVQLAVQGRDVFIGW